MEGDNSLEDPESDLVTGRSVRWCSVLFSRK
jgi:hypothetical protein